MRILAIHDGHNAAAAAIKDGTVTFAVQEERLGRPKNFIGWPGRAIEATLRHQSWGAADIELAVLTSRYSSPPMLSGDVLARYSWQGSPVAVVGRLVTGVRPIQQMRERRSLARRRAILSGMGIAPERVFAVDHHEAHAASAYYGLRRDDDRYLVLTLDGGGDWRCGTVWVGEGGRLHFVTETPYGHSIGDIYSRVTFLMGFTPWEHEYKLMGMAPYASERYSRLVKDILIGYLDLDPSQPMRFRRKVFEPTNHLVPRMERDLRRQRFDNIAGGVQMYTEELMVRWVRACVAATGVRRVLVAGGVFMNIKANKLIASLPEVDSLEAFPSCGDETNVFGGGWLACQRVGDKPSGIRDFYTGPAFDDAAIDTALRRETAQGGLMVRRFDDVAVQTARWLAAGHIVARASGRMEFGARALGNRSILADPSRQSVVPVINASIKSRDFWMPFAPIALADKAGRYIHNPKSLRSPYMMMGFDTTDLSTEFVAGIHPSDKSARMQLLERGQNADLERVLDAFESITGRGVLLNTSFNLHGSPIVCTPDEALTVFRGSGLTHLVMGNFGITKVEAGGAD